MQNVPLRSGLIRSIRNHVTLLSIDMEAAPGERALVCGIPHSGLRDPFPLVVIAGSLGRSPAYQGIPLSTPMRKPAQWCALSQ